MLDKLRIQTILAHAIGSHGVIGVNDDELQQMGELAISALDAGWRPIETAPKDGTTVWLASPGFMHLAYFSSSYGWLYTEGRSGSKVLPGATHWQPLPSPPADKEKP